MTTTTKQQTWQKLRDIALKAGAAHPDLVAAQFALESGWGKHVTGRHNYFGQKALSGGTLSPTLEYEDGKAVEKDAERFLDFDSLEDSVQYLVDKWHKDYKKHKGVNRGKDVVEAAELLQVEGYATDPNYTIKLKRLLDQYVEKKVVQAPVIAKWTAVQDTWLKKGILDSSTYPDTERAAVEEGKVLHIVRVEEVPRNAHVKVTLGYGAGTWFVFQPHFIPYVVGELPVTPEIVPDVDWDDFDFKVTPVLTVGEILQLDKRRKPDPRNIATVQIMKTAEQFTKMRYAWGAPLGVTSFYRPEPINRQVGGVPNSRHVRGMAFDVYPIGRSLQSFWEWSRVRWRGGFGDGRDRGFLHFDTDGGGFVPGAGATPAATWRY